MKDIHFITLLVFLVFASETLAQEGRLQTSIRPTFQQIVLKIDPSTSGYSGTMVIRTGS